MPAPRRSTLLLQFRWIVVSYITRPLVVVLALLYICFLAIVIAASFGPIQPGYYEFMRLLFPFGVGVTAIATQLYTQFLGSSSQTIPHFRSRHLIVGIALLVALDLVTIVSWWWLGASLPSALLIPSTGLVASLVIAADAIQEQNSRESMDKARFGKGVFYVALLGAATLTSMFPEFLHQEHDNSHTAVWISYLLLLLISLHQLVQSMPILRIVLSNPRMAGKYVIGSSGFAEQSRTNRWFMRIAEWQATIESYEHRNTSLTWWQRIHRWRIGNQPIRPFVLMSAQLIVVFLVIAGFACFRWREGESSSFGWNQIWSIGPLAGPIVAGMPIQLILVWRRRMNLLSIESLYPISRKALQRQMLSAYLFDITPLALFSCLLILLPAFFKGVTADLEPGMVVFVELILFVLILSSISFGGLTIVVHRIWHVLAGFLILSIVIGGLSYFTVQATVPTQSRSTVAILATIFPLLGAMGTCGFAWHLWTNFEIGRRTTRE